MIRLRPSTLGLWLTVCAAAPAHALDPAKQITQYGHTAWRLSDGLLSGSPNAMTQTADGYIWIGASRGLMRFDGVRFTRWTPPDGRQLPASIVTALFAAPNGALWIGTEGGLSRWSDGRLVTYPTPGRINGIVEDADGATWFVRSRYFDGRGPLCQVTADEARCFGEADGVADTAVTALAIDEVGDLWVGGARMLLHGKPGRFRAYAPGGLTSNANMGGVIAVSAMQNGGLWVGIARAGRGLGLQQLVNGVWSPVLRPGFNGAALSVNALHRDRHGALWIGTLDDGVYRLHGKTVHRFGRTDGLSGDFVVGFHEDREGTLWVVSTDGIDNFRDLRVTSYTSHEGLASDEIDGIHASRDGTVWIGGRQTLDAFRDGRITSIRAGRELPGNQVTSLFEDRTGRLWVGVDNTLTIYENGRFVPINLPDGRPVGMIVSMTEDTEGNLWAASIGPPRTLLRIRDRVVREALPAPAMPPARRIAAAPEGGLWLGLMSGDLARWRDGRLDVIRYRPEPAPSVPSLVNQLLVEADGTVLGATAFGLIGWKHGAQRTLTVRNGLPCDHLYALVADRQDDVWLSGECGLIEIPRAQLRAWWADPATTVRPFVLDVFDGAQTGFAPFDSATRARDGRLWFASGVRVQVVDPARLTSQTTPPPVHIEEVVADRTQHAPHSGLTLPALTRDLQIHYTAPSFVVPQKVRFRYRLEGHDLDWVDPGTRRQAYYTDLPPGPYRFRVTASNSDGVWNEAGAELQFSVAPAWHQTGWFRAAIVGVVLAVLWGIYQIRVRQVAAALGARFDERLRERTRLARDLHDTLLQTIQASKMLVDRKLLRPSDPQQMGAAATQVSKWLDQAVDEGRAALNSLRTSTRYRPGDLHDTLQRAADEANVDGSMHVSVRSVGRTRELHPIVGDEIASIGREAIRNACMHSGGTQLEVEIVYDTALTLRVRDDGVGIDLSTSTQGKEGHFGIPGMRERATNIGGRLSVTSGAEPGTAVTLIVPGAVVFGALRRRARAEQRRIDEGRD